MDAAHVFKEYLELFSGDCKQVKLLIAPNCVIDWFGRTVHGLAKIHDYLRYEVNAQYEHSGFEKAVPCNPIEYRPMHIKTKTTPDDNVDYVRPRNKVTALASLKSYADSDLDDDDLDMQALPASDNKTPEKINEIMCAGELTPPASTIKTVPDATITDSEDEEDSADECGATSAKRLKRSQPTAFSYLRRLPITATTTRVARKVHANDFDMNWLGEATSSDEEVDDATNPSSRAANEYTPLQYLEVTGVLRAKTQSQLSNTTPSHNSDVSIGGWERKVRIRLSYRRRIADKRLQFALIIYEHQERPTRTHMRRRNLMAQFNVEDDVAAVGGDSIDEEQSDALAEQATGQLTETETTIGGAAETNSLDDTLAFTVPVLRTPTKSIHTPPPTPKRKPRLPYGMSGLKRLNLSPSTSTPKRNAARSLRL